MIRTFNLTKYFGDYKALDNISITINKGSIYGLIGTNGAGKTTLLKHLTGVLKQDSGEILIADSEVFDNEFLKQNIAFVPDDLYFFASYNLKEMSNFMKKLYPKWNQKRFDDMCNHFRLDITKKLSKFSKGMQKQAAFTLSLSTMPEVLILDEPIDGLDPLVRKMVWKYIIDDVANYSMTVLISSHNLREMENVCDSIGILSKGKLVLERDLDDMKNDIHKIQVAYTTKVDNPYENLNILHKESRGTVDLLIVRNSKETIEEAISNTNPAVFDILPLSLEEIFIYELGGENDEFESILF